MTRTSVVTIDFSLSNFSIFRKITLICFYYQVFVNFVDLIRSKFFMFLVAEDVREAVLVEDRPLGDDADVRDSVERPGWGRQHSQAPQGRGLLGLCAPLKPLLQLDQAVLGVAGLVLLRHDVEVFVELEHGPVTQKVGHQVRFEIMKLSVCLESEIIQS